MTNPATPPRILIVDDDADIRSLLADYLGEQGWLVSTAQDGTAMQQVLDSTPIDLIVLDLTLPGSDGLILCRDLRARTAIPVIMLTARSAPLDRILGLEIGADDYLCKPFEPRELLVRIRNVLRRNGSAAREMPGASVWHFADWTLDENTRQLQNSAGLVVMLSGGEYRLLKALLERPNRALNRDQLLSLTQGRETDPLDRSIDLHISRLRQKLGDDARAPRLIKTLRNEGYLLAAAVKRGS
ncbi:transcriptional regulatory protein OmpR [mine drainage metagenome]|uniref:Transcriptional regulatory protein OmpR n=1 Tax=mine drainage metagenome TaxID=410659 RepID=A0A1J5SSR8_9ZZZZ